MQLWSKNRRSHAIFHHVVTDLNHFCNIFKKIINGEHFFYKISSNWVIPSTNLAELYYLFIEYLQSNKADFHTYQSKRDTVYRVLLRNHFHKTTI